MKKILAICVLFALLLPVLAGCQSAFATGNTPTTAPISREEALEIALSDAGLTDAHDKDVELERSGGKLYYDVDFEKNGREYDYRIDPQTGEILPSETPNPPTTPPTTAPKSTVGPMLRQEAIAIALAHAGLTETQVYDLDAEREGDGGIFYEVDFEYDGYEYEYTLHAITGEVLYIEKERD